MIKFSLFLASLILTAEVSGAVWQISYPRPLTDTDQRTRYPVALLALALDQTGVNYDLVASEDALLQEKALQLLGENRSVNVVWSMTDTEREGRLLPIRIPIYKGLIGWRVFMVRNDSIEKFSHIENLQQLIKFRPIQGADWPDTKILQSNGFDVVTSKDYTGLFSKLAGKQGDFLPRSLIEVWSELDNETIDKNISVEPTLGVKYPAAMYFFVNKNNKTLARLLEDGLEKAIKNGKFDKLFMAQFSGDLERANMNQRFFYELENQLLPTKTPIARKELWY